jgi:hypothetical protein
MSVLKRYIKEKACALYITKFIEVFGLPLKWDCKLNKQFCLRLSLLEDMNRGK